MMAVIQKKVCMVGAFGVGKTSLVRRFVHNIFDDKYIFTIGVKVSRKTVVVPQADSGVQLNMLLWDLAGADEFDAVATNYLRGAAATVLVCDLTRPDTLDKLPVYTAHIRTVAPAACLMVAANKHDLLDPPPPGQTPGVTLPQIESVAASLASPYHLTSAKTGRGVEDLFNHLARLLIE